MACFRFAQSQNDSSLAQLWARLIVPPERQGDVTAVGRQYWNDGAFNNSGVRRLMNLDDGREVANVVRFIATPASNSFLIGPHSLTQLHVKAIVGVLCDRDPSVILTQLSSLDPPLGPTTWTSFIADGQWQGKAVWFEAAGCMVSAQPQLVESDEFFQTLLAGVEKVELSDAPSIATMLSFVEGLWAAIASTSPRICLLLCHVLRIVDKRGSLTALKDTFTIGMRLQDFADRVIRLLASFSTPSPEVDTLQYVADTIIFQKWLNLHSIATVVQALMKNGSVAALSRCVMPLPSKIAHRHRFACSHAQASGGAINGAYPLIRLGN